MAGSHARFGDIRLLLDKAKKIDTPKDSPPGSRPGPPDVQTPMETPRDRHSNTFNQDERNQGNKGPHTAPCNQPGKEVKATTDMKAIFSRCSLRRPEGKRLPGLTQKYMASALYRLPY